MSANKQRKLPAWLLNEGLHSSCGSSDEIQLSDTLAQRPILKFSGNINYCITVGDCGMACEEILEQSKDCEELVVGFDMEWPVTYKTGSEKTALIQICADENKCHLFHVSNMKNLPLALTHLLQHPNTKLVGLNIVSDLWKLSRDFSIVVKPIIDSKVIDLGKLANSTLNCAQTWSLERLVLHLMKLKLDKNDDVRQSNWKLQPLSKKQQCYAATDAYVSLVLYNLLKLRIAQEK